VIDSEWGWDLLVVEGEAYFLEGFAAGNVEGGFVGRVGFAAREGGVACETVVSRLC
jgi:hypothetical protein